MKLDKAMTKSILLSILLIAVMSLQSPVLADWRIKLELEKAAKISQNAAVAKKTTGWSGQGYIDFQNNQGQLSLIVYAPADGTYEAILRYSCTEPKTLQVYADNILQSEQTFAPPSTSEQTWNDKMLTISLKQGANNIQIKTSENGGPNLDSIIFRESPAMALDLAKRTLDFVEKQSPRPQFAKRLKQLQIRFNSTTSREQLNEITKQIRSLRREIILSHPLLDFDTLLLNKRPPAGFSHMCDQYLGRRSGIGPGLVLIKNWKDNPTEKVLLEGKLPPGSVLHPDLSFDGKKVLFSFCDHTVTFKGKKNDLNMPDRVLRRFFIYEIGIDGTGLRQITGNANDTMARQGDRYTVLIEDYDPCYLPDGGFAFISTRCQSYGRCHEGRYVPAFVLYRGELDGTNIRRISFGEANEWEPSVMSDGRLVYTRWDYINRHDTFYQSLWTIRPDGTGTAHFYGNYTVNPCMVSEAMSIPGSQKVITTATGHHSYTAGSIVLIDPLKGQDGPEPVTRVTPEVSFPETEQWPNGCFATPYPLSEDLYLAAFCPEDLAPYGSIQDINAFSICLVDSLGGREIIYSDPNISCFAPIPVRPRIIPPVPQTLLEEKPQVATGTFFIQDVYHSTQPIEKGCVKSIRINQIIPQPIRKKPLLSIANNEILKKIVGTVPVNEDGSTAFQAPADVPLQLQLLDNNGMAVMTMRSAIYLQAGESTSCVGCHEQRGSAPIPNLVRKQMTIHKPTPPFGPKYPGGFSFIRTVQPVLDRYCIECHGLGNATKKLNLLATKKGPYTTSHDALTKAPGLVSVAYRNKEEEYSTPKQYFAHAGKLAKILLDGHKGRVKLDKESFQRIVDWLDLNAQFYGDYSWNRTEDAPLSKEGQQQLREYIRENFGQKLADEPIEALVNEAIPTESRILKAPLSINAGGWGQIKQNGWKDTNDPGYKKMLQLVNAIIVTPDKKDYAGTCNQTPCVCGCCWVKEGEKLAAHTTNVDAK